MANTSTAPFSVSWWCGACSGLDKEEFGANAVISDFHSILNRSKDIAVAVAAVKVLTGLIERSTSTTIMELHKELKEAALCLQRGKPSDISLKTACDLFLHFVGRARNVPDFEQLKRIFIETSIDARNAIAQHGLSFIGRGTTILVHGYSRVVMRLLENASKKGIDFSVVVTEGRPDGTGQQAAKFLSVLKIPTTVVLDSGVSYIMERVDFVLVGAGGITENGGVISKLGTYQIALCAKALGKPFYVAAESYKFSKLYPLHQTDVPREAMPVDFGPLLPLGVKIENPTRDLTPPEYISLLFTDLGVLTPAAVSDELIQMYSNNPARSQS